MKSYEIDINAKTITFVNASFLNAANKVGSPEYYEILGLRHDFPGFVFAKDLRKGIANYNKDLTYKKMKEHINKNIEDEAAAKALIKEMDQEIAKHSLDAVAYKAVQAWFFTKFPEVKAQRDQAAADAKAKRAAAKNKSTNEKKEN